MDLLGIGLSGLRTSRNNISVTGHNISNIDTPGYSRQRAIQITNPAFGTGNGYFGSGSRTQTIERIVDSYTTYQVRVDTSRLKDQEAFLRNASELDNVLANENSALGRALNGFFDGVQSASNDPLSKPSRQLLYSQADSVSQRFTTAQNRLEDQNKSLNLQLGTMVSKVNELATAIGSINKEILLYEGAKNHPPNDLFDKREEMLRELSELVDVDIQVQDGLDVHVSIGNGIPLITGEQVNQLEALPGDKDKSRYEINLVDKKGVRMHITNEITGGQMGGVVRYRRDTLDPALNELGRIAIVFAGEMNNQHRAGIDLNGNQGGDFFKDINTQEFQLDRIPGLQRMTPAGVWIDQSQLNKLPAQEFLFKNRGGNLVLHDSVTGRDMTPAGGPFTDDAAGMAALNTALQDAYGFRLTDGGAGNPPADMDLTVSGIEEQMKTGLLISPTRNGGGELLRSPDLTNTDKIALAGIAATEGNAGTAAFNYISTNGLNIVNENLAGAKIVFDDTAGNFALVDKAGNPIEDGANNPITATLNANNQLVFADVNGTGNALEIQLTSNDVKDGDSWVLEGTAGGENGSKLSGLQLASLIDTNTDGTGGYSLGDAYSMLIEDVGIKTSESRMATEVAAAALNQSIAMRESASGVNMDEEAGNLIRFQQAYMASSQVIATAQRLFDTLISSVGR